MGKTAEHGFPRWYKVGSVETRDPTLLKALVNSQLTISASQYDSFESPQGTDYQVPTGKTLYITKLHISLEVAAGGGWNGRIGYGDTGVNNTVAAPTSAKYLYALNSIWANGLVLDLDVWLPVPAGKYPFCIVAGGGGNISAFGIEV